MTVTFTIEVRDLKALQNHARKHSPLFKRVRYINLSLFVLLSAVFALMDGDLEFPVRVIMFLLLFTVLYLVGWVIENMVRKLAFWRSYTAEKQRSVLCEHTITLTDEALIELTAYNESRHRWSGIYQVVDAADYIYIFLSQHLAHAIPKRAFANAAAAEGFYQRARSLHQDAMKTATVPSP